MAEKTRYHVLREDDNAGQKTYEPVAANIEAGSAAEALRQSVTAAGSYVAVPVRSFVPTVVKVETQTVVKVG